ncbi:MAG: hypothetical protein K9G59_08805 [Caulobacter sp.]|nr:hypothetical protein [Caulobacter sp.]
MSIPPIVLSDFSWEAFATLATGLSAVAAATGVAINQMKITRQQLENERLSLRLALFEKRYAFHLLLARYKAATRFQKGVSIQLQRDFVREARQARFLFPAVVGNIVSEIASLGDEYQDLTPEKDASDKQIRQDAIERRKGIRARQDELFKKFDEIADPMIRIDI